MRYLLAAILSVFGFYSLADTEVPYTFTDGTPASAVEMNANFDAIETAMPPNVADSDCFAGDIAKWNGEAWECAKDPLADQNCNDGDRLTFSAISGWSCQ